MYNILQTNTHRSIHIFWLQHHPSTFKKSQRFLSLPIPSLPSVTILSTNIEMQTNGYASFDTPATLGTCRKCAHIAHVNIKQNSRKVEQKGRPCPKNIMKIKYDQFMTNVDSRDHCLFMESVHFPRFPVCRFACLPRFSECPTYYLCKFKANCREKFTQKYNDTDCVAFYGPFNENTTSNIS